MKERVRDRQIEIYKEKWKDVVTKEFLHYIICYLISIYDILIDRINEDITSMIAYMSCSDIETAGERQIK